MRNIMFALILASALLSLAAPGPNASAQTAGSAAAGDYKFTSAEGLPKSMVFDAKNDGSSVAAGGMSFSGQIVLSQQDAEAMGDPRLSGQIADFYMKGDFDCLTVSKTRAVMGGVVREASPKHYSGQRVLLVVEDGELLKASDSLTWILYNPSGGTWVPKDAERPDDNGATLKWIATDAERKDDVGIPQPKTSNIVRCEEYPLSSHLFVAFRHDGGDIRVQQ